LVLVVLTLDIMLLVVTVGLVRSDHTVLLLAVMDAIEILAILAVMVE
jgi:hypothetical protein